MAGRRPLLRPDQRRERVADPRIDPEPDRDRPELENQPVVKLVAEPAPYVGGEVGAALLQVVFVNVRRVGVGAC